VSKPLHTFVALRKGIGNEKTRQLTTAHRASSNAGLYEGHTRTYQPKNEDGDQLPAENKNVQLNGDSALNGLVQAVVRDWNLMATIDRGNQFARADVEVPTGATTATGEPIYRTLLTNVPATFLIYLARELDDVRKYVTELPTLEPGVNWTYDEAVAAYVADPVTTHRTKKVLKNHIKYEATDRHPAQVETFTEDVVDGYWTLVRRSGALPLQRKAELLQRIETLRAAVAEAHQRAGRVDVDDVEVARPLFDYLLEETR
jgi:hypothetical protein